MTEASIHSVSGYFRRSKKRSALNNHPLGFSPIKLATPISYICGRVCEFALLDSIRGEDQDAGLVTVWLGTCPVETAVRTSPADFSFRICCKHSLRSTISPLNSPSSPCKPPTTPSMESTHVTTLVFAFFFAIIIALIPYLL